MAFSDWTFSTITATTSGINSALSYGGVVSAPPGGGSYARILTQAGPGSFVYAGFYPSNASFSDVSYGVSPQAIRVQCMFNVPDFGSRYFILAIKNNPTAGGPSTNGYAIVQSTSNVSFQGSNGNGLVNLRSNLLVNTWYSWRLTCYPISPTQDRLIAEYETTPGSGIWTSTWPLGSGDITINNTSPAYVPWGVRSGLQSRNGVWNVIAGGNFPIYIDNLKVSLATAPVPIP